MVFPTHLSLIPFKCVALVHTPTPTPTPTRLVMIPTHTPTSTPTRLVMIPTHTPTPTRLVMIPTHTPTPTPTRLVMIPTHHPFALPSNNSYVLDFQDYTKPRRLLPTTEPQVFVDESLDKFISSFPRDGSHSLYKLLLRTSSIYDSGLSDLNAGVLICVIDENGDSILQRIPLLCQDNISHFERGSTDVFTFWGPKLGNIQALWISLDSGNWRLAGASLTIVCRYSIEAREDECHYSSTIYNFEAEDVLLGEGSGMEMAELQPSLVTEYSGADSLSFMDTNTKQEESVAEKEITKKESMRDYADLKYSLLLYDAVLIFGGTSIASLTAGENTALAYLTGGIGGFLYLLLLQRSVDELPAPDLILANKESNSNRVFGGLKGQLLVLAFAFGVAVLVTRHYLLENEATLTPKDILVGMMGFLACKVSVVLAAFRPIPMGHGRE